MQYDHYVPTPTGNGKTDAPIVEFYQDAKEDKAASRKEGRPIFRDVEMVRIRFPADRNRTLVRPAHAEWRKAQGRIVTYAMRYPDQYRAFKNHQAPVVHGTPLGELTFLTEASRRMLQALGVYTAEQLAGLEGAPLKNVGMNGREWKNQAQAFLSAARGSADVTRLAAENEALRREIEGYRTQQDVPQEVSQGATGDPTDERVAIKDEIQKLTGKRPQGNPSVETLRQMLAELTEAA